jgi:hypothetical protein
VAPDRSTAAASKKKESEENDDEKTTAPVDGEVDTSIEPENNEASASYRTADEQNAEYLDGIDMSDPSSSALESNNSAFDSRAGDGTQAAAGGPDPTSAEPHLEEPAATAGDDPSAAISADERQPEEGATDVPSAVHNDASDERPENPTSTDGSHAEEREHEPLALVGPPAPAAVTVDADRSVQRVEEQPRAAPFENALGAAALATKQKAGNEALSPTYDDIGPAGVGEPAIGSDSSHVEELNHEHGPSPVTIASSARIDLDVAQAAELFKREPSAGATEPTGSWLRGNETACVPSGPGDRAVDEGLTTSSESHGTGERALGAAPVDTLTNGSSSVPELDAKAQIEEVARGAETAGALSVPESGQSNADTDAPILMRADALEAKDEPRDADQPEGSTGSGLASNVGRSSAIPALIDAGASAGDVEDTRETADAPNLAAATSQELDRRESGASPSQRYLPTIGSIEAYEVEAGSSGAAEQPESLAAAVIVEVPAISAVARARNSNTIKTPSAVGADPHEGTTGPVVADGPRDELVIDVPSPLTSEDELRSSSRGLAETSAPTTDHTANSCAADSFFDRSESTDAESGAEVPRELKAPGKRTPRQYRPVARVPLVPRAGTTATDESRERQERALKIELRLRLEHGGFCQVFLLPRRDASLPEQLTVNKHEGPVSLIALQENWYQDILLPDLASLLQGGIEWEAHIAEGHFARWSLSGRELFVLTQHAQVSGFVSTPRLLLGECHVVLCMEHRAADVRRAINATGSPTPIEFGADLGTPPGWMGFRDVIPRVPVTPSAEGDILDALCPQPDVDIILDSGIRVGRSTWLAGFPPRIRLRGDPSASSGVWIDGKLAALSSDQVAYVAEDWDRPGDHQAFCDGKVASYSLADGHEAWEPWEAYRWSLGELATADAPTRPAICGALALPPQGRQMLSGKEVRHRAVVVPVSNPMLLGAAPGQVYACSVRADLRTRTCTAFPPFRPIWALPADPLHCDKRSMRILLVGETHGPAENTPGGRRDVGGWYSAILAASRKGLLTDPDSPEVAAVWKAYKSLARALRRRLR